MCQTSRESYQIARIHIEEISLLAAAAFQEVSSSVILFQVKVGFGQRKCIQVLCIFLYVGKTITRKCIRKYLYQVNSLNEEEHKSTS